MTRAWYGTGGWQPSDPNPASTKYKWMDAVYPFVKSTGVFQCPDDSGGLTNSQIGLGAATGKYVPYQQLGTSAGTKSPDDRFYGSYGINSAYFNRQNPAEQSPANSNGGDTGPGLALADLSSPSTTIWVADGSGSYQIDWDDIPNNNNTQYVGQVSGYSAIGWGNDPSLGGRNLPEGALVARHGDKNQANVMYCDGHVKSRRMTDLLKFNSVGQHGDFTNRGEDQ